VSSINPEEFFMNKPSRSLSRRLRMRRSALATAAVVLGAGQAMADSPSNSDYTFGHEEGVATQTLSLRDYVMAITTPQLNVGALASLAADVRHDVTLSGPAGTGTPAVLADNRISALVAGNEAASSINLGLLATGTQGADGLGILTGQVRSDAPSRAWVSGSGVAIRMQDLPSANQSITGNTLAASTTLNQSSSDVSGTAPVAYASDRQGTVSTELNLASEAAMILALPLGTGSGTSLRAQSAASIAVGNAQVATNAGQRAGSFAALDMSGVALEVNGPVGGEVPTTLDSQFTLSGNELTAQFSANRSSNTVSASGAAGVFAGSVAVHNLQANLEGLGNDIESTGATARITDTGVRADLGNTLTGSLAITGNRIAGSSTGNAAMSRDAAGVPSAGNAIDIDLSLLEGRSASAGINQAGTFSGAAYGDVATDLALANVQGNRNAILATEVAWTAITANVATIGQGAAVALTDNTIEASATGSVAGNRIAAQATTLSATAAANSVQTSLQSDISAVNYATRIEANAGMQGLANAGSTSLTSNLLGASASGNVADTQVALSATHMAAGQRLAGAGVGIWDAAEAGAQGAATAVNAQSNHGGTVASEVAGAAVVANFASQWQEGEGQIGQSGLQGAAVAVGGNIVRSQALGNDAVTGITLAAANAATSAAAANAQSNTARVTGSVVDGSVGVRAGSVEDSSIALQGNVLAASAVANRADTRMTGGFGSLQSPAIPLGEDSTMLGGGPDGLAAIAMPGYGMAAAQFSIASAQAHGGQAASENLSEGAAVEVRVGGGTGPLIHPGIGYWNNGNALTASSVAVRGNTVSAATTGNQAGNTLAVAADSITATEGPAPAFAALTNLQGAWSEGSSTATAGRTDSNGLLVGVEYAGAVASSSVAVTGNSVVAGNLGNTAANRVEVTGSQFIRQGGFADLLGDGYGGMVQNDVALVNQQMDSGSGRSATTRHANIGVQPQALTSWGGVYGSNVTVSDNRNLAEARSNNAVNGVALVGFSSLNAGAGLLNTQESSNEVSATTGGSTSIRGGFMGVIETTLALTGNATQATAIGNSADNGISVQSVDLQGTTSIMPTWGFGEGIESQGGIASSARFAVGNVQFSQGVVQARSTASHAIDLQGGLFLGGSAAVTGNTLAGIAQANSANNVLSLSATHAEATGGAISSQQNAASRVSATAEASADGGAFHVRAGHALEAQLSVTDNRVRASAGQNEAFNQQTVHVGSIAAASGPVFGLELAMPVEPAPSFSVTNQQQGAGNVEALALPGQLGVGLGAVHGGSVAVTGNEVSAKANVNTASNALTLTAQGRLAVGGLVSNTQTTGDAPVSATVGSIQAPTLVGVTAADLNSTAAVVSGNVLNAVAGGNSGVNALNATGQTTQGASPGFQVLNTQTNAAAMNAAVRNASIGITANGMYYESQGLGMNGVHGAVQSNSVQAAGYGNTASNAIGLSAPAAGTGASASLVNRQTNTAGISTLVTGVNIGITATGAHGSMGVVSGNSVSAQAVGNSSVNVINLK
jgi:hypothetical protein